MSVDAARVGRRTDHERTESNGQPGLLRRAQVVRELQGLRALPDERGSFVLRPVRPQGAAVQQRRRALVLRDGATPPLAGILIPAWSGAPAPVPASSALLAARRP